MRRLLLLTLFSTSCAPPGSDLWPDVEPLALTTESAMVRGGATVMLPVQVYLWTSWFGGCEPPDCPTVTRDGDDLLVSTDCIDESDARWSGSMRIEGGEVDREVHLYDAFGWERDGATIVLDGRQEMTTRDGQVELQSDGLRLFLVGTVDETMPVRWPSGPASLAFGQYELLVDEHTWSIATSVLLDAEDMGPRWLAAIGAGWADDEDALHGSLAAGDEVFDVSGSLDVPMLGWP